MSGNCDALSLKEDDAKKMLACGCHLGTSQVDFQMEQYVYKRRPDGIYVFNMRKMWEKFVLAARAIAAIENPADVFVVSSRIYGQRAILKYAAATGAVAIAGRFTPGTFTNYIQKNYREPRLLVISCPRSDHQAVREASYVNIPVIALCNSDTSLRFVDIAIPTNNKGIHATGLAWWFLAREVLRLRGTISREVPWEVMVDLYFYRDPEDVEKEEAAAKESAQYAAQEALPGPDWAEQAEQTQDWAAESAPPALAGAPAPAPVPAGAPANFEEWSAPTTTTTEDWSATPAAAEWGGNAENWA